MNLKHALVACAASLALAACGGTVDFSIEKDLTVDSTANAGSSLATYDLSAEAGSAWKQRNKIDSLSIEEATAVVSVVDPANTATAVSGEAWLLPEGATSPTAAGSVRIGTWTAEPVVVGNTIVLDPTPELNGFVRDAFNGNGRFSIYVAGSGAEGARVACTLHVTLGAKLKWKLF